MVLRPKQYYAETCYMSKRTVERRFAWIRSHPERYPDAIIVNGRTVFCVERAWNDMLVNMHRIDAGLKPKEIE